MALDDVSFEVHPGEIVALLGPNGAGKTTASRIIGGILAPSQGEGLVDGISVQKDANAVRARCGFVTDQPSLYERMTLPGHLRFFARPAELHGGVRRRSRHREGSARPRGHPCRARERARRAHRAPLRRGRRGVGESGGPARASRCRRAGHLAVGRRALARGCVPEHPRGGPAMKWWLIAWREIRWEVFLDRTSLLRTGIFVVIPLFFVLSNRGIPAGPAGDLTLLGLALQSVFFPALSGVALIAATFSAEKENRTLVPLLAAPIRDFDIVLGKLIGMAVPGMVACVVTLAAGYALAAYRYAAARVAQVLTLELLYAIVVMALLYLVTTGSITMIVAARVKSSRAAQQIAGLVIALSAAVFAGLGFVASQFGEGWPLLALGVGLLVADVLALELARRVWQREEVIGRV